MTEILKQWMTSDDPVKVAHAKWRLGLESNAGPTLVDKARNLTTALLQHVSAGLPSSDPATVDARMAICRACNWITNDGACRKCGCNLARKTAWLDQHCPIDKW